jgi:hypothetical protein
MFEHWDSFYLLVGGASGALIGLLFVVATLTSNFNRDQALTGSSVYMAPVVGHLVIILAVSALALAPHVDANAAGGLIEAGALIGGLWAVRSAWIIKTNPQFSNVHWTDFWWYGVGGVAVFLALGIAAALVWTWRPAAPWAIGAMLVVLMVVAIRNAWDLVTWISATSRDQAAGQTGTSEEH